MRFVLLLVMLSSSLGCGASALSSASSQWYEVRSPRFRLWTEGDPEEARALAVDLERFHRMMLETTSVEEREAAPPLKILIAKNARTLQAWTGKGRGFAGMFVPTVRGNLALVSSQLGNQAEVGELTSRHVLFHEYTHYMMASGGGRTPSWYNEGFAEYMAASEFKPGGAYTVGCPPQYRTRWTQYMQWLPIGRVMDAPNVAELSPIGHAGFGRAAGSASDAYGQSWYLVHFFFQDSSRHKQVRHYLEKWGAGVTSEQAVKEALGLDYGQLDGQLREYAAREAFDCVEMVSRTPVGDAEVQVRPISKAEAHYQVGELLLSMSEDPNDAGEALHKALELQPDYVEAIGALARVQLRKAERAEPNAADAELKQAEAHLERARVLAPESPERLAIAGHVFLSKAARARDAGDAATARSELAKARTAYRKAIHADDALAEAYMGLGATYFVEDNGKEEAQVVLEAAAYLLPLNVQVPLALGKLHIQRNDPKSARPPLEHVVLWGREEERAEASKLLAALP